MATRVKKIDPARLGGIAEIAEKYDYARQTVSTAWASRRATSGFPEPVATLKMGPIYDMDEVDRWFTARRPPLPEREAATVGQA